MNNNPKEIDIARQRTSSVSTISGGGLTFNTQNKSVALHLNRSYGQVYFLIDCSASMAGYKLKEAKEGILDFARDAIRKDYLIGLIEFSSSATVLCKPGQSLVFIQDCLKTMRASGSTNMAAAIEIANEALKHLTCERALVIATDGLPNKAGPALKAGQEAKNNGIDIITIGTDDADQEFLKKLASRTDLGKKVTADHFAEGIASSAQLLPMLRRATNTGENL
jgi:Mg-chelatase subunit ChlD